MHISGHLKFLRIMRYIILERCDPEAGIAMGGRYKELKITKSVHDCILLVQSTETTANGMTWYGGDSKTCSARFNATHIYKSSTASACLFTPGTVKIRTC